MSVAQFIMDYFTNFARRNINKTNIFMKRLTCIAVLFTTFLIFAQCQSKNKKETFVRITTTEGNIVVKLYDDTPLHRDNFVKLVSDKTYQGVLFHRVIKNFMIQAGDPDSKNAEANKMLGNGDLGYNVPAEIKFPKYYHKRGALAAARTGDDVNPEKASSASQFYIVTGKVVTDLELDTFEKSINNRLLPQETIKYSQEQRQTYKTFGGTPHLDGNYTVFGEVVTGFEVLDKIQNQQTDHNDRPLKDVVIKKMKVIKK